MRTKYLLIAMIMLAATSCKKETVPTNQRTETVDSPPPCSGNDWELDAPYNNDGNDISLVYNNKIYLPDKNNQTVSIFDGSVWSSIPSEVPIANNTGTAMFTIGNKGYILNSEFLHQGFWEYNFSSNTWRKRADFPGIRRFYPAFFSVGSKGYIVGGTMEFTDGSFTNYNDTWEYNPLTNTWSQKASLPYIGRSLASGFNIGNKGYIVGGSVRFPNGPIYLKELLEYNPSSDNWTMKSYFPGANRESVCVFVIADKAYAGAGYGGWNGTSHIRYKDYYKYSPSTNSWVRVADLPLDFKTFFGFSINSSGYAVLDFGSYGNGMVKYTPQYCFPGSSQNTVNGSVN